MGAYGDWASGSHGSKWHIRMLARSVMDGWDVPLERRPNVVNMLLDAVDDPAEDVRTKVIAAKALLTIPRLQIDAIRADRDADAGPKESNPLVEKIRGILGRHRGGDEAGGAA